MGNETGAVSRLKELFDEGTFLELEENFRCGVAIGYGTVYGKTVCAFSQDREVLSGAVTEEQTQKIQTLYQFAAKMGCPLVGMYDSAGVQVAEGAKALKAYSQIMGMIHSLSGVVPQISLVLGTCVGTSALIAESADIIIAQEKASFYIASQKESVTESMKSGNLHFLEDDEHDAIARARELLQMLPSNNLDLIPLLSPGNGKAINASMQGRELSMAVADEGTFFEWQKDYARCMVTALAAIEGQIVGIVASEKEQFCEDGANKVARFLSFCDAFSIPIVTMLHTTGLHHAQSSAAMRLFAKLSHLYAEATTLKISVITGSAIGFSYIAFSGAADLTMAWENSVVSALPVETAVEFLWHDKLRGAENLEKARKELAQEYSRSIGSVSEAAKAGAVDLIIPPESTREQIAYALHRLSNKRVNTLPKKHGNLPL